MFERWLENNNLLAVIQRSSNYKTILPGIWIKLIEMEAFLMIWRFFSFLRSLVEKAFQCSQKGKKRFFSPVSEHREEWTEGEKLKQEMRVEKRWASEREMERWHWRIRRWKCLALSRSADIKFEANDCENGSFAVEFILLVLTTRPELVINPTVKVTSTEKLNIFSREKSGKSWKDLRVKKKSITK